MYGITWSANLVVFLFLILHDFLCSLKGQIHATTSFKLVMFCTLKHEQSHLLFLDVCLYIRLSNSTGGQRAKCLTRSAVWLTLPLHFIQYISCTVLARFVFGSFCSWHHCVTDLWPGASSPLVNQVEQLLKALTNYPLHRLCNQLTVFSW